MEVERGKKKVMLDAIADTGNDLRETFSGKPVIVVPLEEIRPILTQRETQAVEQNGAEYELPLGMRLIPYCTIDGCGMMKAFEADRVWIWVGKRKYPVQAYLAVAAGHTRNAIFHPGMIRILL